ncbi:MAG: prepilin peptidase [Marinibacterium sp.]
MTPEPLISAWLIVFGPAAGSFVAAQSDRYCQGRSLLLGRSRCDACGSAIAPMDLIPLVSYPVLGGRCRACRTRIPTRIWFAEWAGLGLAVIAVVAGPTPVERILLAGILFVLLGLFLADRTCWRLPDVMTAPLFGLGWALGAVQRDAISALVAGCVGAAALWGIGEVYRLIRGRAGLGFGDVKMLAGISAAVGWAGLPWVTLLAASSALAVALLRAGGVGAVSGTDRVPLGSYLAVAGGLACVLTTLGAG